MHPLLRLSSSAVLAALAALATLSAGGLAQAQDSTLKAGGIYYQTHAKTNGITGIGIPPGADATVGNATTLGLSYEYALSPNVGVELVLGVPPKIKASAAGSVAFLGEVLTTRIVAPTLLVNYHFFAPGSTLRPYVGVGINYTRLTDTQTPHGWDVHLSDSTGLAAHVGVDWAFNKQWGLFASLGATQVRSDLTATGATVLRSTIDFRPVTYTVGASYRF
ncbi:MAG: outer membrane beta-barrel protein [Rubrivivax sp.]|nr:outer membrane beta-barrel protein [Rubrivivax sp.]